MVIKNIWFELNDDASAVCLSVLNLHISDGLHMATMHPFPHISTKLSFFGALGYTEHEIEC